MWVILKYQEKKKKKKLGNHSQRKANEHLVYSVRGRSRKTSLGCNYFDSKKNTYSERERGERAYPIKEKGKEPANSKVVQITENRGGVQQI